MSLVSQCQFELLMGGDATYVWLSYHGLADVGTCILISFIDTALVVLTHCFCTIL